MSVGVYKVLGIAVLIAAAAAIGFGAGRWQTQRTTEETPKMAHGPQASETGRKVLYWYDPMVPQQKFDKPGKSPFMDMMLVPKYADEAAGAGVAIDPGLRQNLGMRFASVARERTATAVDAVATVGFDERNVAIVQARSNAFVQRVYPHAPSDLIAAGTPLADLLMPEWWGAQHEFLALRGSGDEALIHAGRSRMRLLGMPDALIERVEREGTPQNTLTIRAPIAGVIQELGVRAGMTLNAGATLARINSIASVWLEAAVPETQAALVRVGADTQARFAAYPNEPFKGRVTALLPEASRDTRTLRVRMEYANPGQLLRPGMFAQVTIVGPAEEALVVPAEAVIRTGKRALVFVTGPGGALTPVEIELGPETDGKLVVRRGLSEGQQVVASGQFLVDSEASLRGVLGRMQAGSATGAALHEGTGRITAFDQKEVTLNHGPIPSLRWGTMTMAFKLARPELSAGLKVNDEVRFRFRESGDEYVIEQLEKAGAGK